jgi:hypothetical protein
MRTTVLMAVAALGLASPAGAETQEQRYFSARDAAIAKVTAAMDAYTAMPTEPPKEKPAAPEKGKPTAQDRAKAAAQDKAKAAAFDKAKAAALDKVIAMDKAERAKLEGEMREIVGPMPIAGFDKDGKLNLDGLIKGDQGFGALDGLTFTSSDKKASIIVTTTGIFPHWLAEHKDWWGKNSNDIPQQPGIAVQQNAFYTQALVTDSAIVGLTELHVRKPLGSVFVFAMLGGRTQDAIPEQADEIFVAMSRKGHVFVGQSKNIPAVGPIAACESARKAALDYRPSTDKKAKDLEAAFLKCFSSRARFQPNYAEALRAAQQMIDSVAAR